MHFIWKGVVKEIGFYLSDYVCQKEFNGVPYNAKLRWDWARDIPGRTGEHAATNPLNHEFAILRQQPSGNQLYLMAHVEANTPPPPDAKITVWLRAMQSDREGIRAWLSYSGACPYRPNQYHFRKLYGQETLLDDQLHEDDKYLRLRQSNDKVDELATYDHARDKTKSNYDDSSTLESSLTTHELRGRARYDVGEWRDIEPTLPTLLRFVQAAGVEKVTVEVIPRPPHITVKCGREWLPTKNQADILYYSGHGHSKDGSLECWGKARATSRFTVADVAPSSNWKEDLDYFIIAGCSVLHPDNTNGFAWGKETLKKGLLKGLAGYAYIKTYWGLHRFSAPSDRSGISKQAVQWFVKYLSASGPPTNVPDRVLEAWLLANINCVRPGIVYNVTNYWMVNVKWKFGRGIYLDNSQIVISKSW